MSHALQDRLYPDLLAPGGIHRALVLGATGFVGGALVRELASRGVCVRALRRWSRAPLPIEPGAELVEWVVGDLEQPESVQRAALGCDVIFHAAGVGAVGRAGGREALRRSAQLSRNVIEVARQAEIKRLVVISSAEMIQGDPHQEHDEASRYVPGSRRGVSWQARYLLEAEAQRAAGQGLPVVLLQPGLCLGRGPAQAGSVRLLRAYAQGRWPVVPAGPVSVLDVRDLARGAVEAALLGRDGARYVLGGHNTRHEALAQAVAALAGAREPLVGLPGRAFGWSLPVHVAHLAGQGLWLRDQRARRELGWSVRPLEETLRWALDQLE